MIRPRGPFTVRPLRAAVAPRRQAAVTPQGADDRPISVTPPRRPVKALMLRDHPKRQPKSPPRLIGKSPSCVLS